MLKGLKQRLVTILLMVLLCCSGYLYYRGYRQWQYQQQQMATVIAGLKPLFQQISQQASLLNKLEQQFSQQFSKQELNQRFAWQERAVLDMQHAGTLQRQRLEKLRSQILKLTGSHDKDWRLIALYGLLRKADRKWCLEQDPVMAQRLLRRAESMCTAWDNAVLLPIRRALMEDSRRLAGAVSSDNEGTLLNIISLVDRLDPTLHPESAQVEAPQSHAAAASPDTTEGGVRGRMRWYQRLLYHGERLMHRFVTIQRYVAPVKHTFFPGEHSDMGSYCESLRAYLLLAAQAAARQQHERYQQWLGGAAGLLQTRFDLSVPGVTLLLEQIEQLRQHASVAKPPQKLESLRLLEGFLQSWTEDEHAPVPAGKRVN